MHIQTEKGKHYTSPQAYTDESGLSNQFTMINHDVHTSINVSESSYDKNWNSNLRTDVVGELLSLPASLVPELFFDLTKRGEEEISITWRKEMLEDTGIDVWKLVTLRNMLQKRLEIVTKTY